MFSLFKKVPSSLLLLASLFALSSCAKNPVTGHSELMLVSEKKEIAIGEQADREIRKQFGVYLDQPKLTAYVDRKGTILAQHSQRANLVYHFQILDTDVINAFAIPGGYVYVTRGLLLRLNSEDELAMVVGHEIGHVAARHGAQRLTRAYLAQGAIFATAIFSPGFLSSYGNLVDIALNLGFLGYSRRQEAQADDLGIQYMTGTQYNPRGGIKLFKLFQDLEDHEPGSLERFLLSHPPTKSRMSHVRLYLKNHPGVNVQPLKSTKYLRKLKGLRLGQATEEEVVTRTLYIHKRYGLSLPLLPGWSANLRAGESEAILYKVDRGKDESGKKSRKKPVRLYVEVEARARHKKGGLDPFIKKFLKDQRFRIRELSREDVTISGIKGTAVDVIAYLDRQPTLQAKLFFLPRRKNVLVFSAYTEKKYWKANKAEMLKVIHGLKFPSAEDLSAAKPARLSLYEVQAGDTWGSIAKKQLGDHALGSLLREFNGHYNPAFKIKAGEWIKMAPSSYLKVKP